MWADVPGLSTVHSVVQRGGGEVRWCGYCGKVKVVGCVKWMFCELQVGERIWDTDRRNGLQAGKKG
jgi:hypothetical protein